MVVTIWSAVTARFSMGLAEAEVARMATTGARILEKCILEEGGKSEVACCLTRRLDDEADLKLMVREEAASLPVYISLIPSTAL